MPATVSPLADKSTSEVIRMGRPRKRETKPVRIYKDMADALGEIAEAFGIDSAEYIARLITPAMMEAQKKKAAEYLEERAERFRTKSKNKPSADIE